MHEHLRLISGIVQCMWFIYLIYFLKTKYRTTEWNKNHVFLLLLFSDLCIYVKHCQTLSRDRGVMSNGNVCLVICGYCGYMPHTSAGLAGACYAVPNVSKSPCAHSGGPSPWLPETRLNIIHCLLIFPVQKNSPKHLCVLGAISLTDLI